MSCNHDLLVDAALRRLSLAPSRLLEGLARELQVSRRTLQNAINMIAGKTFRELRDELLVKRVKSLLESYPTRGIKQLSFELGFKSPRSFARAIKRACGFSPAQLRSRIIFQLLQNEKQTLFPVKATNKKEVGSR
jgi:AraC-like DNA-binding protein